MSLPNAVTYLRVSTTEQAKRGGEVEGYSIPAQREACKREAQRLEAEIAAEFVDRGASARSANRPQLKALLTYLEEHAVRYVIVHKIDRLAREPGGPRRDHARDPQSRRRARLGHREHRRHAARRVHADDLRRQCPAVLGEPRLRGTQRPPCQGQARRHPRAGAARLPERARADRRPRGPHRPRRSGALAAHPMGLHRLRLGRLHAGHALGRPETPRARHPADTD